MQTYCIKIIQEGREVREDLHRCVRVGDIRRSKGDLEGLGTGGGV